MRPTWTDERVEQLKTLWAEGLSAREIAARLGGVNRNAVIGKAHRLRLSRTRAKVKAPPRVRPQKPSKARLYIHAAKLPPATEGFNELPYEEPTSVPVAFVDLERHHCRWPADAGFCGVQASDGKPYCDYHQRVATRR